MTFDASLTNIDREDLATKLISLRRPDKTFLMNISNLVIGPRMIVPIAFGFGLGFFFLDAFIDSTFFDEDHRGFLKNLMDPTQMDLWMRIVVLALIVSFSLYVSFLLRGLVKLTNELTVQRDFLAQRVADSTQELRNRNRSLEEAKFEAELANKAKSRFMAAVSHDLRQPLTALGLYVGALKNQASEPNSGLVSNIDACCVNLTALLTDLLDVSMLDAGVAVCKKCNFNVDDLLKSLVMVYSADAHSKGLRLRMHPCPGVFANTDPVLLNRMIGNLISNAIRFTHKGGILVACRQRAGARWLEVWDTGIGIPPDMTKQVFHEFVKVDGARSEVGCGLGLSIVAKTAALLGLQIRLQTKLGQGSMFAIELPSGRPAEATVEIGKSSEGRPLRIGLVEDNSPLMDAMVLALEGEGHTVVAAKTCKDLLARLGLWPPDLVISDYRLGNGETGVEVVDKVRAVFGNGLPALITTGDTDPALAQDMDEQGIAIHYKPLNLEKLLLAISEAVEHRSS